MEFGGSWFVVRGRRFLCTYYSTYCSTVQKLFENSFRRFRSRSLQRIVFKKCLEVELSSDCQRDGARKRYKLAKLSVGDRERIYEQHR